MLSTVYTRLVTDSDITRTHAAKQSGKGMRLHLYTQDHVEHLWGTTPDTHGGPYGLRPQGRSSPQDEALRGTTLLGASRKTLGRYSEDATRSVRICMIP